ncbi:DUF3368 domain-containing protein [Brevibacillus centrosporus]|uniref:Predicted nucleic acid-binding protein, contains PIN domain n=1 Tax=Brevibacillus centrosporus TaxID=54910 RepID=A0A1I4CD79_9BACL|nr:DUF3368 domain-containing protein [Brevibacillus centrosporus]MEC2130536.1 DUF3368 domain-containing protein [Brevibacillus centrosporus]MED4911332.1 DUF3368 domain-containing protein [Brevibacillus centrosporus]RNB68862.1 DUF3368 domain-containing protein [Brevibacillus centrosporus]SFK78895.1 Predicted nucleic acid-binding protein, contains PIN domain [Brevibacillus centrosporus]GED34942.1 DUF3368 domain-containing protein [Brevibacillus centrosporus]
MRKVISNSSPIIALSMIGHLSLMNELFDEVYLPAEVYREIVESESLREHGKRELQEAVEQGRFQIYQVQNEELVSKLYGKLHRGELEVIIGAKELGLEVVIIDEKSARRLADTFMLNSIGTVGLLLFAKKKGKITEIRPYLDRLLTHHFRISTGLYKQALFQAGETDESIS